jgi:lipopolysaccharide exporter
VEFGKHIEKGFWALSDKALPAIFGVGFIFLVVRVLPPREFGAFVIVQTIFNLTVALGTAFAFAPLTKFAAETDENAEYISASGILGLIFFVIVSLLIVACKPIYIPLLDREHDGVLGPLVFLIPLLFATAFFRTMLVSYLQAKYQVKKIFWIDAVYLLGALLLIFLSERLNLFSSAYHLIVLLIISQGASSLLALFMIRKELSEIVRPQQSSFNKIWDFGKYSFMANSSYNVFAQMDVFFISSAAGVSYVAIYNAAKIVTRIFDMLSQLLMMFLMPYSSKYYTQNRIDQLVVVAEKSICFSTLLLLPACLIMIFFPGQLMHLLYKGKYDEGIIVVRIFGFLALSVPWNAVASSYMAGMAKVKESLYFGFALLIFSVLGFSILTPVLGFVGAALVYVGSLIGMTIGTTIFTQKSIPYRFKGVVSRIWDVKDFVESKILMRGRKRS